MATPTVYVLCNQNCKYEGMTKEQILAAITQAITSGSIGDVDTGFITTIKTINGTALRFFVGTQEEYNALSTEDKNGVFAIISNDATKEGLLTAIASLEERAESIEEFRNEISKGTYAVPKAIIAQSANSAERDSIGNQINATYISLLNTKLAYSDNAANGVELLTNPSHKGSGDLFAAEVVLNSKKYSFGLVWYDCGTVITQGVPVDAAANTCLYLKIEEVSVLDSNKGAVQAKVTLWRKEFTSGSITKVTDSSTTITLKCVRNAYTF